MNWLQSLLLAARPRRRVVITPIASTTMRAADWCASPECTAAASRLFATPEFRTIISILRNESPASYGLPMGASHDDQIAHSYKAAGYQLALNTLESLATHNRAHAPLEATFAPEPPRPRSEPLDAQQPLE